MLESLVQWLDRAGPLVFWSCAGVLVAIDSLAAGAVVLTRSRELVNRWTGALLTANVLLLGVGAGVPATLYVTKVAVRALTPAAPAALPKDADVVR